MPKAEVGTPKYLANKMKAKGLQKLRWFCQMCEKQCRDENGFKCHTMSESHQRQLLLFADNPHKYVDEFSRDFSKEFLLLLRRQFGTKRVLANKVYQEYISDKGHLHMNSTRWETLTGFVKWLGREGKVIADETEKGWFITYIDRDPETIRHQEKLMKKEKMAKDDEEETMMYIEKQIERNRQNNVPESKPTELLKDNDDDKLSFKLGSKKIKCEEKPTTVVSPLVFNNEFTTSTSKPIFKKPLEKQTKRPLTALEEIKLEGEKRQRRMREKEEERKKNLSRELDEVAWLAKNIVVKVISEKLGEEFHNKKAVVKDVIDRYGAVIKMIDSKKKIKIDQKDLQTVIPNIGGKLLILHGKYAGAIATMEKLNITNYSVDVQIIEPSEFKNKMVNNVAYEHVSKVWDDTL